VCCVCVLCVCVVCVCCVCVVWCGVVWCGVVWCGVLCCVVLWCVVLCCVVLCCVVLCCVVLSVCVCGVCVCVSVCLKAHFWCAIHQCSSRIHFPLAAVGLERYSIKRTKNRLGKHHLSLFHGPCLLSLLWRLMTIDDSFTPKALTGWTLAWWLCGQSELVPS